MPMNANARAVLFVIATSPSLRCPARPYSNADGICQMAVDESLALARTDCLAAAGRARFWPGQGA